MATGMGPHFELMGMRVRRSQLWGRGIIPTQCHNRCTSNVTVHPTHPPIHGITACEMTHRSYYHHLLRNVRYTVQTLQRNTRLQI